jgi:hypothetical protein
MQYAMKITLTFLIIIFNVIVSCASAQLRETKQFSSGNALCSETIILDNTGHFFKEQRCEGKSTISFGRYTVGKEKNIRFYFLPFDSIAPINRVVSEKIIMEYDSLVTVTFYDRFKEPLATNWGVGVVDKNNKVHEIRTDEKGQVEVNRFIYHNIVLIPILSLYGKSAGIDLGRESLSVYLNLPRLFLKHREVTIEKPRKLTLQLKRDGLYKPKAKVASYRPD